MKTRRSRRTETGSMYTLAFIGMIPLLFAIGAFAVDTMHFNAVQAEIQRACDAGALAGAQDLWEYTSNPNGPLNVASTVAKLNDAEGKPIGGVAGATVTPTYKVTPDPSNQAQKGQVQVTITMPVQHIFAGIFGAFASSMTCTAVAGAQGTSPNQSLYGGLWPMVIAWGTKDAESGKSLSQLANIGDIVYLDIHNNVEWTGFNVHNAHTVTGYIDAYMNPGSNSTGSPSMTVGDTVNVTHGVLDSDVRLTDDFVVGDNGLRAGDIIYMPVVDETTGPGNGNFNGVGATLGPGDYKIKGFIAFKFLQLVNRGANSYLKGQLVSGVMYGTISSNPNAPVQPVNGPFGAENLQAAKLLN